MDTLDKVAIALVCLVAGFAVVTAEAATPECLTENVDEPWRCYGGVCGINQDWYDYGQALLGSECFDWENRGNGVALFCVLDGEYHQVLSFKECNALAARLRVRGPQHYVVDDTQHPDGDTYREHWCASRNTINLFSKIFLGSAWYGDVPECFDVR